MFTLLHIMVPASVRVCLKYGCLQVYAYVLCVSYGLVEYLPLNEGKTNLLLILIDRHRPLLFYINLDLHD